MADCPVKLIATLNFPYVSDSALMSSPDEETVVYCWAVQLHGIQLTYVIEKIV